MTVFRNLFVSLAVLCPLHAGILVMRVPGGFRFAEAVSITLNGKDKALNLGSDPKLGDRIGKLASIKPAGAVVLDADSGVIADYEQGRVDYLFPEGLPKNAQVGSAAAWRSVKLTIRAPDKTVSEVNFADFVAFLPAGLPQLTSSATDHTTLELIGGKSKVLDTQLALISSSVRAYPADPSVGSLEKFVEQAMQRRYEIFEEGTAGTEVLQEALRFAQLSAEIYPAHPAQARLRELVAARKAWLDRRVAVIKTFAAVQDWDSLLTADRDLERYEQAFPDLANLHREALKQSLDFHRRTGEERLTEGDFASAYREFHLASLRQPSDKIVQQKVLMAWTDYSRRAASDRIGDRKQLGSGPRAALEQALRFAAGYKDQNKLDEALRSSSEAEAIDPDSLPVLLKKAEILGARGEFTEAFSTLDKYDLRAVEEEREKASNLRNDLLFKRASSVEDIKAKLRSDWSDGNYNRMRELALRGLAANADDTELLYQAALASVTTRHAEDAKKYLTRYLEVSNTLDSDPEQRKRVRTMIAGLNTAQAAGVSGVVNWMSGMRLPGDVYYCPASLAFQTRIDHIEASGKLRVAFEWEANRLRTVTPSFEKVEHPPAVKKISFAYNPGFPVIEAVSYETAKSISAVDADDRYKHSALLLSNSPYVDVPAVQKFAHKNVGLGISGNKYFLPFVWDEIHYFRLTYDEAGRVVEARELSDPSSEPGDSSLEFNWDGMHLTAIRGYQGTGSQRHETYERTLIYQGGRLESEQIRYQGKTSKITYTYNGSALTTASCEHDPSLDDRSRTVVFRQEGK
jgi:hypothetical protein